MLFKTRTVHFIMALAAPLAALLLWVLGGCAASGQDSGEAEKLERIESYLEDYRNIPGVTKDEIAAIEALKAEGRLLHFGTFRSGEAIVNRRGRKGGFLIHLAESLSSMFDIELIHEYVGRRMLYGRVRSGFVDLACEIPYTEANRESLFMTTPVFERLIKVYKRRGDSLGPLTHETGFSAMRPVLRYGFLEGAGVAELILAGTQWPVETVLVTGYREAVDMLMAGSLDAFFDEAPAELYFEVFAAIESSNYYPPINTPLSLATGRGELVPIISVFQKFLDAGGRDWLFEIYSRSADEIRRIYFEDSLSLEQERLLARLRAQKGPILFAAGSDDYPATFYNERNDRFEGIAHDVLSELSMVTGLRFEVANPPKSGDGELKEMIKTGAADFMVDFNYFDDDAGEFPLSYVPHNSDRYALITTFEHPEISFSQIAYVKVGLVDGNKFSDVYLRWFPHARNVKRYDTIQLATEGLRRGEVDCLMASSNYLLNLTNYLEEPLFKAALVFDEDVPHGLAFAPSGGNLRALIDQGMGFVEIEKIRSRWYSRRFDYRHKFLKDAAPWLIIFCALLIVTMTGLFRVNRRNKRLNLKLESMVSARTDQLATAKENLGREKLLTSSIVATCPVSLLITKKGKVLFLNPYAESFLGKREGDNWEDSFADKGVIEEYRNVLATGGEIDWRPTRFRTGDGQIRETLLNTFESDYYGESAFMSWIADVTELRKNAAELALARDVAEDSARAKSEFLANMSHEIRTPMNAILGLTQLTLQTELDETQRDYLEKTAAAAKSLLGIINDILDFSKIEAGKLLMETIGFKLESVLEGVVALFTFKARDKGLELVLRVEPNVRTALVGDPLRLGQVLNNLMGNAIKFTEKGGVALSVQMEEAPGEKEASGEKAGLGEKERMGKPDAPPKPEEREKTARLLFKVIDTGIGLSREQIESLFTAFNQADSSFTRRYGGTGLGLAISKRMVEMMGGRIWAEGELGKGSIFVFTAEFGLADSEAAYFVPQEFLKGKTALCVDDYPEALDSMSDNLRNLGLEVSKASSGQEAMEKIRHLAKEGSFFDIAVIDALEGDMDAFALASSIIEEFESKNRPALVLAAPEGHPALAASEEGGFKAAVLKPATPQGLIAGLEAAFDESLREALKGSKSVKRRRRRGFAGGGVAAPSERLKGARILLAEDNEVNQLVASRFLKNAGLAVDVANNGQEAVELAGSRSYDLVLMDIQMPVMDGLAATKAIRSLSGRSDLPIVAMTAHAMSGDREQSLAAGMNDHITKPINLDELFGALNRWIVKPEERGGERGEPQAGESGDPKGGRPGELQEEMLDGRPARSLS